MNSALKSFIVVMLAGFILSGCSSTRLVSSWHDPSPGLKEAGKVLVIALAQQDTLRRKIEDEFVRQLAALGADAEQSYRIFPDEKLITPDIVKAKLQETGKNAVLVTHLVDIKRETVYVPATTEVYPNDRLYIGISRRPIYYDRFSSYYSQSYAAVSKPGYTYDRKLYVLETNLYAVSEKLLWTAVTESKEPASLDTAIRDFVGVITADMKHKGLLQAYPSNKHEKGVQ